MKGRAVTNKHIIPADFKPRIKFVKNANMWLRVSAKDGKIVHEWFAVKPTEEALVA